MDRRNIITSGFLIVLVLCALSAAFPDGMMFPPIHMDIPQVFSVKYHHVDVDVQGQSAVTSVDQVFHNDSSREMEGLYMFPLLEGAAINRFSMFDGNREIEAKILNKDEARQIYESIVHRRKDPALLEYVGRNAFRASVYPIPANGDKRIKLQYTEVLKKEGGLVKYVYPLSTERFSARPLEDVRITIKLTSKVPITNIYSPSHEVNIEQKSPTEAVVEWKGKNIKPDRDLVLYYALSDAEFPIQVLTHHEPGEPGYFMLLASPKPNENAVPMPKDVVFVLDRTGSMSGKKIEQAQAALNYCLNSLRPNDRFNVVAFNEDTTWFRDELVQASKTNISAARKMVDSIDARGGTNINKAMKVALSQYSNAADKFTTAVGGEYIVFLTDGQPTVGETDTNVILKAVAEENKRRSARIFVFGLGDDVNAQLLDRLAQDNKADADYVRPSEDIEVKVTAFFDKVSSPVLTDVKLTASSTGKFNVIRYNSKVAYGLQDDSSSPVHDMCPSAPLPDMFKGGQLIVIGQFDKAGDVTFTLSGHQQGKDKVYKYNVNLPKAEDDNEFIPRLWAARKIGYLLDEIRLHRSQELIDEVIRLSKEFGIPTEFTSFLADEREVDISKEEARMRVGKKLDSASRAESGSWAVTQSANARQLRNQSTVSGTEQRDMYVGGMAGAPSGIGGFNSYKGSGFGTTNTFRDANDVIVNVNTIQNVGTRTFYQRSNQWVDARYQAQKMYKIKQYSDAHFQLLEASPELRQYSTLGEITVVLNGNAIQISNEGKDKLSAAEVKAILGNS